MTAPTGRIVPLPVDEALAEAEAIRLHPDFARLEAFRVLLHHPPLAKAIAGMLIMLLYKGRCLDERLRELVIMRLGWATASEYEWAQHWQVARDLGIPAEDLAAVRDWQSSPRFDEADRAVLAAVDETLATGAIGDATFERCAGHVGGVPEMLELVAAIGNWRMFSQLLRSLRIPLEPGVAAWPPDGVAPPVPRFGVSGGDAGREGIEGSPRVPLLPVEEATRRAEELGIDPGQGTRGPFRTVLHHPPLARAMDGLLKRLLYEGILAERARELIIMRIAWRTGSACEWARHRPFCQRAGITDEELIALRDWHGSPLFDAADRAALAATDETLETGTLSDAAWTACADAFPTVPELLELVVAIGNWRMYSQLLRSAAVPLEPTDTPWPPDGRFPTVARDPAVP
jgi:alkylhydroperoxidase family enzyme